MLYTGMFFFSLAIVSGLYGFAGVIAPPAQVAQIVFYTCLLLASVTFSLRLLRAYSVAPQVA